MTFTVVLFVTKILLIIIEAIILCNIVDTRDIVRQFITFSYVIRSDKNSLLLIIKVVIEEIITNI